MATPPCPRSPVISGWTGTPAGTPSNYANALRDELPDAVAVLDACHVVSSAPGPRRSPRRGHRDDPLHKIRGLLRRRRVSTSAGDPDFAVTVTWSCYQQLRSIYQAESNT